MSYLGMKCEQCGKPIDGWHRYDLKFCSPACKQRAYRQRKKAAKEAAAKKRTRKTRKTTKKKGGRR